MTKLQKSLLVVLTLTLMALSGQSKAALPCGAVEILGNHMQRQVLDKINSLAAGYTYNISPRKKLIVRSASDVSFSGCSATLKLNVKLTRKLRRDAIGNIVVKADVKSYTGDEVCFSNVKVKKINLSNTTGLGESIYKAVANKAIPNNLCVRQ